MCNGLHHRPDCTCPFGPGHGRARHASGPATAAQLIRLPGRIISERLWYATTCWWCSQSVFFFRNENGGCALFDEPGAPWPVHGCWRLHTEAQRMGAQSHYQRQAARPQSPIHQVAPAEGHTRLTLVGYVARVKLEPVRFRLSPATRAGAFASVLIIDKHNRLYHLLLPEPGARKITAHDTVRAPAAWQRRAGTWHLFADTVRVDAGRNRLDLTITSVPLAFPARCVYCGDVVNDDTEWGIDPAYRLECHACSSLRGRVSEEDFALHCTERAALRSVRAKPLPDKLPGTYTGGKRTEPGITLSSDHRWRWEGDVHPAGDFSYHQEVVRLYDGGEVVYAFRVRNALNGVMLREVHPERSRGRRGDLPLTLFRATAEPAPRAAPRPTPKPPEKRAASRRELRLLEHRFQRAHARYEVIVAHELALNKLFMLAGRRTKPAHWASDAAEIGRIRAELAEECRRLRSSCRKLRLHGARLGIFENPGDSGLARRFAVLEQNADKHPRARGPVPAGPAPEPRPVQPAAATPSAEPATATPSTPPAKPVRSTPSAPAAPPRAQQPGTSSDFAEKLRRALATPGESIWTENR